MKRRTGDVRDDVLAMERALGETPLTRALQFTRHAEDCTVRNVKLTVKGNMLTITVDLKGKRSDSRSGKTEIIASTEGNVSIPDHDDIKLGLNLYASK